ncbi:MAG: hypothetical protein AAGB93_09305, partial [Planctomycetota bacterium]
TYLNDGGYEELKTALGMEPKTITEEVKKSGLRGRGGAGTVSATRTRETAGALRSSGPCRASTRASRSRRSRSA